MKETSFIKIHKRYASYNSYVAVSAIVHVRTAQDNSGEAVIELTSGAELQVSQSVEEVMELIANRSVL